MTLVLTIVLFYAIVLLSTAAVFPWLNRVPASRGEGQPFALRMMLALALGTATFLVLLSLVARLIPDYRVAVPVTLGLLGGVALASRRLPAVAPRLGWRDGVCLLAFLALHLLLWTLRRNFSNIHFEPGKFGAEKLFNLSLQQSFLFGRGYPPESLWLAGEREAYYILPRLLPGVVSFFARLLGAGREVAGIAFHLSDTFYHALALATTAAGVLLFSARSGRPGVWRWMVGLFVGLLPFLSAPVRAMVQTFSGRLELWSLSRIIDNTINEYPFWNYLWADNHAHSNGAFLDVGFVVFALLFLASPLRGSHHVLGVMVGVLAAAVAMAQSGSVVILLCVLVPMGVLWLRENERALAKEGIPLGKRLGLLVDGVSIPVATALVCALPDFVSKPHPQLDWRFVPSRLASPLLDYLNVHGVMVATLLVAVTFRLGLGATPHFLSRKWGMALLAGVMGFLLALFAGYPVAGMGVVLALLAALPVRNAPGAPSRGLAYGALAGAALIMMVPEFVAANFNMGEDLIRFNTVFKFLYDSFYLWPVLVAFAWCGSPAFERSAPTKALAAFSLAAAVFLLFIQYRTFEHRLARQSNDGDFSGFAFLERERPRDARIADFLYGLPGRVVLAEECGMPPKPASYAVAGRISAYSGRPALCGWGMHSYLHHNSFWTGPRRGQPVWPYLLKLNEELSAVFDVGSGDSPESVERAREAVAFVRDLGATHLVFGEWEQSLHTGTTLSSLARIAGKTVFETEGVGVVELTPPPPATER